MARYLRSECAPIYARPAKAQAAPGPQPRYVPVYEKRQSVVPNLLDKHMLSSAAHSMVVSRITSFFLGP